MFPPLCTQCPGERCPCPSRSEQLPPAGSTGQLARAVTTATGTGGPGGWRAPGRPPAAPPLGWVPVGRGGGGVQSHPTVSPPREANRRMQVPRRALHTGSEVPCPVPGHSQVPALGHPLFCCFFVVWMFFFPSKFVGAGWCALPRRALPAEGARSPISPGGRPQPQSYLDVRHLRPRSLTPAWAWRRHSPFALAGPAGWHGSRQDTSGRPGGPRRDWRD